MTLLERWSHRNLDATHHLRLERLSIRADRIGVLAAAGTDILAGLIQEARRLKLQEPELLQAFKNPSVLLDDTSPEDALDRLQLLLDELEGRLTEVRVARGSESLPETYAAMAEAAARMARRVFGDAMTQTVAPLERPLEQSVQILQHFPEFANWVLLRLSRTEALFLVRGPVERPSFDLRLAYLQGFIRAFDSRFALTLTQEDQTTHIRCKIA